MYMTRREREREKKNQIAGKTLFLPEHQGGGGLIHS